jgi:hypothetical protein|tara:strand:- start:1422 stop:4382 length:2961 start_codon:yes stop_codon:yes gene_type:complete
MSTVYLVTVAYYDVSGAAAGTLYYSNGTFNSSPTDTPANTHFQPRLKERPRLRRSTFSPGKTGGKATSAIGEIVLINNDGELDALNGYAFDARAINVYRGEDTAAFPDGFTLMLKATASGPAQISRAEVRIPLRDRQTELDVPLQTTVYAGNNALPAGLEGVAGDLKAKPKPILYGNCRNITPPLVNTSKLIYQISDGAIDSVEAVRDAGVNLGRNIGSLTSNSNAFLTAGDDVLGLAYSESLNRWCAVGHATTYVCTSDNDGATWTARTSGFGNIVTCVAWSPDDELFVAGAEGGELRTSPDGISWTSRTSNVSSENINAVVYGGDAYIIVADGGKCSSSLNGTTWTARSPGHGTDDIKDAAYGPLETRGGTNTFVICGAGGRISYTTNKGVAWTNVTNPGVGTDQWLTAEWLYDHFFASIPSPRINLATYPEELDNAVWVKTGSTIAVDAVAAPDTTSTADKVVETTANSNHQIGRVYTKASSAIEYTLSAYVKDAGRTTVHFETDDALVTGAEVTFDIAAPSAGSVTDNNFTETSASIEDAGSGWFRCILTFTTTTRTSLTTNIKVKQDAAYVGDASKGLYIWGVTLEQTPLVASYVSTDGSVWTEWSTGLESADLRDSAYASGLYVVVGTGSVIASSTDGKSFVKVPRYSSVSSYFAVEAANNMVMIGAAGGYILTTGPVDTTETYGSEAALLLDSNSPVSGAYGVYLAGGYVRLGSPPSGDITVDATAGDVAGDRTGAQLSTDLLLKAGMTSADWSSADITALDTANASVLGLWTGITPTVVSTALSFLAATLGAWWGFDKAGVFRTARLVDPLGLTVALSFTEDTVWGLERVRGGEARSGLPSYRQIVKYNKNYTVQNDLAGSVDDTTRALLAEEWQTVNAETASVKTAYLLAREMTTETAFSIAANAATEATRRQALRGTKRDSFEFSTRIDSDTLTLDLGQIINVTHSRFGLSAGKNLVVIGLDADATTDSVRVQAWG